ncbi:MAG: IS1182 family transposase [Candidatus Acidiferrales bacterium]
MLFLIAIHGGLLIMMGQHSRSESLFYYFRIEDQVPENHLLRLIDRHISFNFVREKLKDSYSDTGRPSIDPELLLRILLIGYLYGVTSERKLVEELQMHLAWRWFTGLSFDQEIPHHSTFSKNRHGRFHESDLFQQLFEEIVDRCQEAGLVEGEHLSVDGSFIAANASRSSRIPREQLAEAAQVKLTIREYLTELEQQNPIEEPTHQQALVSTTDPDSTYATKGSRAAELGYFNNYLIDNQSGVIVGVQATAARLSQESVAAREMITRSAERRGRFPQSVAADTTYGNGELLAWLEQRGITPYIRVKESPAPKTNLYGIEKFIYDPETNSYQCPAGKRLTYLGVNPRNRNHIYRATWKRCRDCPQKAQCTRGHYRQIAIHVHEAARQRARERTTVPAFAVAQRQRRKVEALFAELKNQIGLRRVRLRRMKHVREQFFLAATAQNLKRLARFLRSRSLESATVPI